MMQHLQIRYLIILFSLSSLWLATCSPAPKQILSVTTEPTNHSFASPFFTSTSPKPTATRLTVTPTPTSSPKSSPFLTFTSTPVPTLTAHTWNASVVLVFFDDSGGDGCCAQAFPPPKLILYANGELFIPQWIEIHKKWRLQLTTRTLGRGEVCSLLNAIDQAGFFDYDPATYLPKNEYLPFDGAPTNYIQVNAWRSNTVALNALGALVEPESWLLRDYTPPPPTILPAIRDTYKLLFSFHPNGMKLYQPERVGVWINEVPFDSSGLPWTLHSPKLAEVYASAVKNEHQGIILKGKAASFIYQLFDQSIPSESLLVSEGQSTYRIYAQPLLPYQDLPDLDDYYNRFSAIPAPEYREQTLALSCQPSDGIYEVPAGTPAP